MLSAAGAPLQRITHQMQGPEDAVAEEHRASEPHGQLLDTGEVHPWTHSPTLDRYCSSSSVLIDSMVVLAVVVLAVVVLVDYRVTLATGDEPAVDREGRHERYR